MTRWLRRARLLIGIFAIVFAVVVFFAFKRRTPPSAGAVVRTGPGAVVETTGGRIERFTLSREDVSVEYEKQQTFADGSTKMFGVTVTTKEKGGTRTFVVTGKQGQLGQNEATITLDGDVRLTASDGLTVSTDHASYTDSDGTVRTPGAVTFTRGRLTGAGVGMSYDKSLDALAILDQAVIRMAPDAKGAGGLAVTAGAFTFARRDHLMRFERTMHIDRGGELIDADNGIATLTADDNHVDAFELHGNGRIVTAKPVSGGLEALSGEIINLKYAEGGELLQHAVIAGSSNLRLAGDAGKPGRQIIADTIDIALAADGSTPTALLARQAVQLTFPAQPGVSARTIRADTLDAKGEAGRGLTRAGFGGAVRYRESGPDVDRRVNSDSLDVGLQRDGSGIDEANFSHNVHFAEGTMDAYAAAARYAVTDGTLALTGTEPAAPTPRVANDKIKIDATQIDVTLEGSKMKAHGNVKSELQAPKKDPKQPQGSKDAATRLPSMLKQDQPVNVTAADLDYDGAASRAVYKGAAQLWQGETSVKGTTITIDDKTGDLSADGPVTTTTMLEQVNKEKARERVRSIATAGAFKYEEAQRRAIYTGDAHMSGPQGDMTAARIDLYLKPSGDELEKAEAHDDANKMTLREQNRVTTGLHMTYTTADEQYHVTGAPVTIVDQCNRETTGRTLTFHRATDTIVVDGKGFRTQTKGAATCS
jgi:lipopolysaccharide export system protein LptA